MCLRIVFLDTSMLRRMDGGILLYLTEVDGPQRRLWCRAGDCDPQLSAGR
jgi:hypothetical protein